MGMFDSIRDADGAEWQTKAYGCDLTTYYIGDRLPNRDAAPVTDYQVEIIGGPPDFAEKWATIRDGRIAAVSDELDATLPLWGYHGGWLFRGGVA